MTVETATFVKDLNAANPAAGDPKSEGDDHLRLIKNALKTTLPDTENIAGFMAGTNVTVTAAASRLLLMNYREARLTLKAVLTGALSSGQLGTLPAGYRPAFQLDGLLGEVFKSGFLVTGFVADFSISTAGVITFNGLFNPSGAGYAGASTDVFYLKCSIPLV